MHHGPPGAYHRPHYGTVYCAGRKLDSTTREEGDWASTCGEKADELPLRDNFFSAIFQIRTASARSILFFRMAEKGNRLEGNGNKSTCKGAGGSGQGDQSAMKSGRKTGHGDP